MKSIRSKAIKILLCIAVIIPLVIGSLTFGGIGVFTGQDTFDNYDETAVAEAATTDTFLTGLPNGKKFFYTDITTGITMSNYASSDVKFGSGMSDKLEVIVSNPTNKADGTQTNPYAISTKADWQSFVDFVKANSNGTGKYFILNANLDYDGEQIPSLANFNGVFYGANHVIKNVKIGFDKDVNQLYTAAIFQTTAGAYISDLIVNNYVMNTQKVESAPIVARAGANTNIANCSAIGVINANDTIYSGATKGFDSPSVPYSSPDYSKSISFGGIVAYVSSTNTKVYKCSAKVDMTVDTTYTTRDVFFGGILGCGQTNKSDNCNVYDSYAALNLYVKVNPASNYICSGGIVGYSGYSTKLVQNCVAVFKAEIEPFATDRNSGTFINGQNGSFKNSYAFYDYGEKSSAGVVTKYKLGAGGVEATTSGTNLYAYTTATTQHRGSVVAGLIHTNSLSDLWDRATKALNPDIWVLNYLGDNIDTTDTIDIFVKPVHVNPAYITYKYSNDDLVDLGVDGDGNKIENPVEYSVTDDGKTALPKLSAPTEGGTPDPNRVFVGWTLEKDSASSKVYSVYSRDIVGNVDAYPVWKINDFDVETTGATLSSSNLSNSAEITYTNNKNNTVVLTANISTACTLDSANRTYTWFKNGVKVSGETRSTLTLKNVADSGKYTVQVTAVGSGDVLWRGDATSDEFDVKINRGSLELKSDFAIDGKAFVGEKYSDIKFTATAIDAVTKTKVNGDFAWAYPDMSVNYATGESVVKTTILFDPADDIFDNYLDASVSSSQSFSVSFTPDEFYLIFHVESFGRTDLKAPIKYDTEYSAAEVCDLFTAELTEYYKLHPEIEAGFSGQAPKLGVPCKNGVPDSEGEISDYTFIDEYNLGLPKMKTELTIQIIFAEHPITITFDPNGGVLSSSMEQTHKFGYNELIKSYLKNPSYPTNSNMRFQYWYYVTKDEDSGRDIEVQWNPDYSRVTGEITLKAKWREVVLTLKSISVEQYPNIKLIARNQLKDGDLKVTAYYIDDEGEPYDEVLEFNDYKNGIKFVNSQSDLLLHIGSKITVSYTYGNPAFTATSKELALTVNPIDLKTEDWDIYLNKETGEHKVVMRVNENGDPVNLNVRNMVPDEYTYFIDIDNIKYTYSNIGGKEIDPSQVINKGIYNVKIEFPTFSDDYIANPIFVELELKDITKIFVEWTNNAPYYFNGKVQHPTAVLKDADGVEILARDWEYEFLNGDGIQVAKGHSIGIKLLNNAYEFDNSTTTFMVFEIQKAMLDAPTVKDKIEYAGTYVNLADHLDGFDPDLMEIVSGGREMAVDSYTAIIKIKEEMSANCQWANGASTQIVNWSIEKRTLTAIWSKSTFLLADVGAGVNPKVTGFVGMYADDLAHFNFDTDLLYSGDIAKTEQGAYKISVKLNNQDFSQNYTLSENVECPFVIVLSADVKVITVVWNDIPLTGYVYNGQIQAPSLDNITILLGDKDVTDEVIGFLTLDGDIYTSKWAGTYKATLTLDENCGYSIISGFEISYKIVKNQQGEGEKPADEGSDPTPPPTNSGGSDILQKIKDLIDSGFPLWQIATMAVAGLLTLIFFIKTVQYGNRKKKAKGEAKKLNAKTYAALAPIFSTEVIYAGLTNQIWSIIAFSLVGLALIMFVAALISRKQWKKAELAKETAQEEYEQRRFHSQNANQLALQEKISQIGQGGASVDNSIFEQRLLEMEERHRQEMARRDEEQAKRDEAMKIMLANMMGRQQGMDNGEMPMYGSIDDTDLLVQKVIAGLLPAVQQMMPDNTAYLTAPGYEESEELKNLVEVQNEQMRSMSEQISELQNQIADMSQGRVEAEIIPDNSEEIKALTAEVTAMRKEMANRPTATDSNVNIDVDDIVNKVAAQITPASQGNVNLDDFAQKVSEKITTTTNNTTIVQDVSDEKMQAMAEQMALMQQKIDNMAYLSADEYDDDDFDDEEEWDSILDEEDDDFVEAVIIEDGGTVRKTTPNFRMRLKQSSDKNREWYTVIKNMFCSQKGVTYRVCKRVEKIRYQGQVIGVIGIAKRSIKLWLALKPYEYDARRYHQKDVSDKPRFVDVPMYVRVGSDRALTRAQELILALFQELNMEARKRYNDRSIQELIFTLKHNKLLTNKQNKQLLCEVMHVHDCDVLDDETAEKCIEAKNVDFIDDSVIETVKLDDIDTAFQDGNRVTLERLKKVGLVSEECTGYNVVADKRLTKPLIIVANDFTLTAVKLITLTGGRAIKLQQV